MGKRFHVYVSDKAHKIIVNYQKHNNLLNRDEALDKFILEHGSL